MIFLNSDIIINVKDSENYFLSPEKWYKVIGTQSRDKEKENNGKKYIEKQDVFMVVNDKGRIVSLFPSKCEIRILSDKKEK